MRWPPSLSHRGVNSRSGSMTIRSSCSRSRNVCVISFLAAWLLPLPVVPRMNPLPFMPRVRSMTSGLPLLALTPWNTPPGWHSS